MQKQVKFGIIGCSTIANRSTIPAIKKSRFATLEIIGSRSMSKAEEFAKKFDCSKFGTYEEVLEDNEVDAVYISIPNGLHEQWSKKAAKSGKHVLCEKSSVTSFDSALKVVKCCKENEVRIMEGFMFRFHPQHIKVLELIKKNEIGELFVFKGMYGFPPVSKKDIRYNVNLGGGVLNETGCYPIFASRMVFGEEPVGVVCNLYFDKEMNVDIKGHSYILYNNHKAAMLAFGFENSYQANYRIWGTHGIIELKRAYAVPPDFATVINVQSVDENKEISIDPSDHFKLMIDVFCQEILGIDICRFNFETDLINQARVMEAHRISNQKKQFVDLEDLPNLNF